MAKLPEVSIFYRDWIRGFSWSKTFLVRIFWEMFPISKEHIFKQHILCVPLEKMELENMEEFV